MNYLRDTFCRDFNHDFDLICGKVVAHEFVFDQGSVIDFDDTASRMVHGMENVFTGQAVLERGSANSDVFEE